jgi:hypothetical protein
VRRSIMIVLIAILALALAAPTVLAQSNGGAPEVVDRTIELPVKNPNAPPTDLASLGCTFPLRFEITGKEKEIALPDGGTILTAPGENVTVTNLATNESVTYNITGVTFSSAPDQDGIVYFVITGRNLALDPNGTFLNIGRFTFALDLNNPEHPIFAVQKGKGQAIDVCQVLS